MIWAARGAMVWAFWRRGCSSHRQATWWVDGVNSARPWTVRRIPATVRVWDETEGDEEEREDVG